MARNEREKKSFYQRCDNHVCPDSAENGAMAKTIRLRLYICAAAKIILWLFFFHGGKSFSSCGPQRHGAALLFSSVVVKLSFFFCSSTKLRTHPHQSHIHTHTRTNIITNDSTNDSIWWHKVYPLDTQPHTHTHPQSDLPRIMCRI